MRVHIAIETDDGILYEGEAQLSPATASSAARKTKSKSSEQPTDALDIDFELPIRPFIKKYSHSMSGPKRLTLLIARIAKGNLDTPVERAEVSAVWNKMTALMGGRFNSAYETRAKDSGWLDSPKPGMYHLLPNWRGVLES